MFGTLVWKSLIGSRARFAVALAAVAVPAAMVTAAANFTLDAEAKMSRELRTGGPNLILEARPGLRAMDPAERSRARAMLPPILAEGPVDRPGRLELSAGGTYGEIEAAVARIHAASSTLRARTVPVIAAKEGAVLGKLRGLFVLIGALVLSASGLAMATALTASVSERRQEIGLLQALGAARGRVVGLFAGQVGLLLAIGVAVGAAAGMALSAAMVRGVFGVPAGVRPAAVAAAAVACAALAFLASIVPVRRALAVEPARVLKGE
jgi:hypothetical protein